MSHCTVEGCEKPLYRQGMCHMHRNRVRRNGTTEVTWPKGKFPREIKPPEHGTQRAYAVFGCRCEPCKEGMRERARDYHRANRDLVAEKRMFREYGITRADFDRMNAEQDGKCLVCGGGPGVKGRLYIDHCHTTGEVRGLLCTQCNTGLGMFADDPDRLLAAAAYLLRSADVLGELR